MSTQGLNADLPSPDGFDGTHGVAPNMWFIVDIPQLHIKLSKKRRKALKMQNIPKNHQKTLENAPYNYAIFERIS